MSDLADRHKTDVLNAADDFFKGNVSKDGAAQKLQSVFAESIQDGSAQELVQKMRSTPNGMPNAIVDAFDKVNPQHPQYHLEIWPGLLESTVALRRVIDFDVKINLDTKTVKVEPRWHDGGTPG